jgi:hypothetical protein
MKNSLKAAAALIAIAVVSVVLLALANRFFPKYVPKLDADKVTQLNAMLPTGADDATALDESYFSIDADFDLEAFNKNNGAGGSSVLAVYKAEKGAYAGSIITETQSTGYGSQIMILLTSYGTDGKINGFAAVRTSGDYLLEDADKYEKLKSAVIGKTAMTQGQVLSSTGATAAGSASGVEKNLALSGECYRAVKEGA